MIVLGFDTVTKLALKLIGSFQNAHPSNNMDKMLVKSYLGAGFGRVLLWVLTLIINTMRADWRRGVTTIC